jgi:hypothetical protein
MPKNVMKGQAKFFRKAVESSGADAGGEAGADAGKAAAEVVCCSVNEQLKSMNVNYNILRDKMITLKEAGATKAEIKAFKAEIYVEIKAFLEGFVKSQEKVREMNTANASAALAEKEAGRFAALQAKLEDAKVQASEQAATVERSIKALERKEGEHSAAVSALKEAWAAARCAADEAASTAGSFATISAAHEKAAEDAAKAATAQVKEAKLQVDIVQAKLEGATRNVANVEKANTELLAKFEKGSKSDAAARAVALKTMTDVSAKFHEAARKFEAEQHQKATQLQREAANARQVAAGSRRIAEALMNDGTEALKATIADGLAVLSAEAAEAAAKLKAEAADAANASAKREAEAADVSKKREAEATEAAAKLKAMAADAANASAKREAEAANASAKREAEATEAAAKLKAMAADAANASAKREAEAADVSKKREAEAAEAAAKREAAAAEAAAKQQAARLADLDRMAFEAKAAEERKAAGELKTRRELNMQLQRNLRLSSKQLSDTANLELAKYEVAKCEGFLLGAPDDFESKRKLKAAQEVVRILLQLSPSSAPPEAVAPHVMGKALGGELQAEVPDAAPSTPQKQKGPSAEAQKLAQTPQVSPVQSPDAAIAPV